MKQDKIFKNIFLVLTLTSILSLVLISLFLIIKGMKPLFNEDFHLFAFLTGMRWDPSNGVYGIGYMIAGSVLSTVLSIIIVVPIGILTSVCIVEFLPKRIANAFIFMIEILAGIPSVIYGLFGLGYFVPKIAIVSESGIGQSLLAVVIVLSMMVLPTIIAMTVSSLRAVNPSYRLASLGLGADKIQTTFKVIVPAAKSGIVTGVILGVGRAIGETMAVSLVAGNVQGGLPTSLFDQIRPLTSNVALEMGYATGLHQDLLFTTGLILFIFIMLLNSVTLYISRRGRLND